MREGEGGRTYCDFIILLRSTKQSQMPTSLLCEKVLKIFSTTFPSLFHHHQNKKHKTEILLWRRIQFRNVFIYATKRRVKLNLFKSNETYTSSSSGGQSLSSSMSSIYDNSEAFLKPNKSLFVVFSIFALVFLSSTSALPISPTSNRQIWKSKLIQKRP